MQLQSNSANLQMMNKIATDIVVQKAVEDKMKQAMKDQEPGQEKTKTIAHDENEDDELDNLSDVSGSSGEREAMRRYKEKIQAKMHIAEIQDSSKVQRHLTGGYNEKTEKEFFEIIDNKKERVIVHFFHRDFIRCKIIDKHLANIAYKHPETLFIRINAQQSPFLVGKLKIKVLPVVYYFENGNVKDIVVGFEEFGNGDDFKELEFTRRLAHGGGLNLNDTEKFKLNKKEKRKVVGDSESEEDGD
jgi:hypothetical protein